MDVSDLWVCPRCGKRFVIRNMSHSCGRHTVEQFMEGKSPVAWQYWNRLVEMARRCGPCTVVANKTRLELMVRTRFVGMDAVSDKGMTLSFWLKHRIESPRFRRVDHLGGDNWLYHLRVSSLDEMDEELQRWLCLSYEVGAQRT